MHEVDGARPREAVLGLAKLIPWANEVLRAAEGLNGGNLSDGVWVEALESALLVADEPLDARVLDAHCRLETQCRGKITA